MPEKTLNYVLENNKSTLQRKMTAKEEIKKIINYE